MNEKKICPAHVVVSFLRNTGDTSLIKSWKVDYRLPWIM